MLTEMSEFVDWLNDELEKRGWSYNELGRRADLSSGGVSIVMTERQKPGYQFCIKVALALKDSPERVLRLAGLLPTRPDPDPYFEVLENLWDRAPDWKKRDIVVQLRAVLEEQERYDARREVEKPVEEEELRSRGAGGQGSGGAEG